MQEGGEQSLALLVGGPLVLVQGRGDGGGGQEGSWCGVDLGDFQK